MDIKLNNKKLNPKKILMFSLSMIILGTSIFFVGFENIYLNFIRFKFYIPLTILIIFISNIFLISFRLKTFLSYSGLNIPFLYTHLANVQGQFLSIMFISFFGQTFGRQITLRKFRLPSVFISSLTILEKLIIFLISGLFCFFGFLKLGISSKFTSFIGSSYSIQIATAILLAFLVNLIFNSSKIEKNILKLFTFKNFFRFINISSITFISQFLVIITFTLAAKNLNPTIPYHELLAASAVTSFAAALPISINGWGIRELAAVFSFGIIGINPSQSIAISILIGITSTFAIIISYLINLTLQKEIPEASIQFNFSFGTKTFLETVSTLLISSLSIIFIFFQFNIPIQGEAITINISDPFAICAFVAITTNMIFNKNLVSWKIKGFNMFLFALTLLIFISFLIGVNEIGVTQWALTNRLFGWFILLGYLSIGPLINLYIGKEGIRKAINILVITAIVVIVFTMMTRFMHINNFINLGKLTHNFEGFSGNRNAFAFKLICCLEASLALSKICKNEFFNIMNFFKIPREMLFSIFNGFIISGICLSGSQAGIYTTIILLFVFSYLKFFSSKLVLKSIFFSIFIVISFNFSINNLTQGKLIWTGSDLIGLTDASNTERLKTILIGLKMWRESIFLGSGLGVFLAKSPESFGKYIVIHSTPVWILAEFGLLGFTLLITEAYYIIHKLYKDIFDDYTNKILIMNICTFCIFSSVHEIFYQRIFWLFLGLCLSKSNLIESNLNFNENTKKNINPLLKSKNTK